MFQSGHLIIKQISNMDIKVCMVPVHVLLKTTNEISLTRITPFINTPLGCVRKLQVCLFRKLFSRITKKSLHTKNYLKVVKFKLNFFYLNKKFKKKIWMYDEILIPPPLSKKMKICMIINLYSFYHLRIRDTLTLYRSWDEGGEIPTKSSRCSRCSFWDLFRQWSL